MVSFEDIGQEIASRHLFLGRGDSATQVVVRIGLPFQDPDESSFHCPFEIKGIGDDRLGYAVGTDSIQALELAIKMVEAKLEYLVRTSG